MFLKTTTYVVGGGGREWQHVNGGLPLFSRRVDSVQRSQGRRHVAPRVLLRRLLYRG